MVRIAVFSHEDCLKHDTGTMHPEKAKRISAIMDALKECSFANKIDFFDAPIGTDDQILLAHTKRYLDYIKWSSPADDYISLDADTIMSPRSYQAALRAVGAGIAAVDKVIKGEYKVSFCIVRPPGHHATSDVAMGFCIFNNIAIATSYAIQRYNLERVAIVDFDVHHGNGTQSIFESDVRVLFISTHQWPLWPGSGSESEKGVGNVINLPLSPRTDGVKYREVFKSTIIPALEKNKPQLIMVSAGFDGHLDDPLANFGLVEDDYNWIGQQLNLIANKYCNGKVISFLEGGYNLGALSSSVVSYLEAFAH